MFVRVMFIRFVYHNPGLSWTNTSCVHTCKDVQKIRLFIDHGAAIPPSSPRPQRKQLPQTAEVLFKSLPKTSAKFTRLNCTLGILQQFNQ